MGKIRTKLRQVKERMPEGRHVLIGSAVTTAAVLGAVVYFGHFAPKLDATPKVKASVSPVLPSKAAPRKVWLDDPAKMPKRRTDIVTRQ